MSIQLMGIREGTGHAFFKEGWTAPSVAALLAKPNEYIKQVPEKERWNIYFTLADCHGKEPRDSKSQNVIAFDIDHIDISKAEATVRVACEAVGVDFNKTASICSGYGVWLFIEIEDPITEDAKFFAENRELYKFICSRIDLKLKESGHSGKADASVFSPKRLARMPLTINKKEGRASAEAYVIQGHMEPQGFRLETACGAPNLKKSDSIDKSSWRRMSNPDTESVLKECRFLKYSMENQATLSEPEWYATLGVVGFLKDGDKLVHQYSSGHPGYTEEATNFKFETATKTTGPRTCKSIDSLWGGCNKCPHFGKVTTPCQIKGEDFIETEDTGFYKIFVNASGKESKTEDYEGLIKYYKKVKGPFFSPTRGAYYTYDKEKKHWRITDETEIKNFAYESFMPKARGGVVSEFLNTLSYAVYRNIDWMRTSTTKKLNFQNGVLNLDDMRLYEHSEKYGFLSIIPYAYDPAAKCPKFEKFLDEITCQDDELKKVLLQYMGYALSGDDYIYHKALILYGTGRNGKSTLNNILKAMVGELYYSTLDIKALQNDQQRAMLEGKLFNVADENSPQGFIDTSIFKCLSSGGEFTIKEVYKKPLSAKNKAKLIFNCNELPNNMDTTDAFYERLLIVPFEARFLAEDPKTDPEIEKKLLDELPGILNLCLKFYKEMIGGFSTPLKSKDALDEIKQNQDDVGRWAFSDLKACENKDAFVVLDNLYSSYTLFCERTGIKNPRSLNGFGMRLSALVGKDCYKRVRNGPQHERRLYGYEIKKGF